MADTLTRGATAPIRLGLAAGELGLAALRSAVGGARRALSRDSSSSADGWRRPYPPRVWSPAPEIRERARVDDEPEPVAEFAGAEVHVDPPWDGYDKQTAAQIRDRLAGADREVAAAVSLYEGLGRKRVSVVRASDRRLRGLDL
ncbi:MAG TPA: hypothetical protein VEW67_08340 [Thermoleophilaceae bacterium]|nr:hypothetical protein [Thermoleophilaceae bacterium]